MGFRISNTCIAGAINSDQSDGELGQICPIGYHCPEGQKIPCDSGTYGASTGLKDLTECSACPPGYDCTISSGTVITNIADHKCAEGYYCLADTGSPGVAPVPCVSDGNYFSIFVHSKFYHSKLRRNYMHSEFCITFTQSKSNRTQERNRTQDGH